MLKTPTPSLDKARAKKAAALNALQHKLQRVFETEGSWWNNDDLRGLGIKATFHEVFNNNATQFFMPSQVNPLIFSKMIRQTALESPGPVRQDIIWATQQPDAWNLTLIWK